MLYIAITSIPVMLQKFRLMKLLLVIFVSLVLTNVANAQYNLKVTAIEGELALFQSVDIKVDGLEKWVNSDLHDFILCIDGDPLNSSPPRLIQKKIEGKRELRLRFDLKPTKTNKAAWGTILSRKPRSWSRTVSVTVSFRGYQLDQSGEMADPILILVKKEWLIAFIVSSTVFAVLFYFLAHNSDIIRVSGAKPTTGKRKRYSLARTQTACWFFIIVVCYVFIWFVTGNVPTLTNSVLWIVGISSGINLGATIIGSKNKKEKREQAGASSEGELVQAKPPEETKGFLADILNDDNGMSFHRFQMVIWTLVLIVIFVAATWNVLAMPDFDATLLGLMGISGGTYLGFKLPKQQG